MQTPYVQWKYEQINGDYMCRQNTGQRYVVVGRLYQYKYSYTQEICPIATSCKNKRCIKNQ